MCELEKNGNLAYNEFVSEICRLKIDLILEKGKIKDVLVMKSSPCGLTSFVSEYMAEKYKDKFPEEENLLREVGFRIQHYPLQSWKNEIIHC
jgi:hypothetical protein